MTWQEVSYTCMSGYTKERLRCRLSSGRYRSTVSEPQWQIRREFVGKEIMEEPLEQYDKMLSPAVQFDFKNVTFTFLPHQVKDMDALVKDLESKAPDIVGVASYEQCKGFVETLSKYQKFTDIRNVGAAIHSMIENAAQKMDDCGFTEEGEWTYLAKLFGSNAVPGESASVIQQAIKKAEKEGTITSKNRWQLIEYLCADYLSGR